MRQHMATRNAKLKSTRARQKKAQKDLYVVLARVTGDKAEAKALTNAIHEAIWANLYHFIAYVAS